MCSMSVLCPLCTQTSFSSIDALRCSLIKAANGPLACPICHELFLGLDKLTIHLFSHTNIMNSVNQANATTTPTTHNQKNIKNNEKLKTQQIENLNNINNSNGKNTEITQTHLYDGVNFNNTHHPWEKNMVKMSKAAAAAVAAATTAAAAETKADITIVNKTNIIQQHESVAMAAKEDQEKKSKHIENLAQCDICEFTFRNEELKNMHIRLVHENLKYHKNIKIATSSADGCYNASMDHDFKCHLCAKTFKTKGSLRVHLKVVHLMGLPYINNTPQLTICDRIRYKENKILKSAKPTNNDSQLQSATRNEISTFSDFKNSNNCNIFNISPVSFISNLNPMPAAVSNIGEVNLNQSLEFSQENLGLVNSSHQSSNVLLVLNASDSSKMESSLDTIANNIHSNTITNVITTIATNDKDGSPKLTSSLASVIENPKIWECDVCSKAFTTKYFLKKHKRLHTGEMPYTCELCARTFTFQQSYHKHLLYHSDEKPHVCSTCGRAFKELSTLHNHERIHSGEKPFKCEVCGKSFRQRVSFLVHTRIHTGVMPYKCEICQRSFRYKVSQRTHKCQPVSAEESPQPQDDNSADTVSENFIKAFLETSAVNRTDLHLNHGQNSPSSNEIAAITGSEKAASLNEQQALLAKTIDDIVVESCNKMGIGSDGFTTDHIMNEGSMSPSQKLQNMSLYSPQMVAPDINAIEGDLTRFFLENSQAANNLL